MANEYGICFDLVAVFGIMQLFSPNKKNSTSKINREVKRLWLDLGDLGVFIRPAGAHDRWQDHGMGLLRTILQNNGVETDMFSLRSLLSWRELNRRFEGYDTLIMNVRSYTISSKTPGHSRELFWDRVPSRWRIGR